jgi:Family of unknown function (DUF6390)
MSASLHTRAAGEAMFARYAYPPNQLGYCGQGDGEELLDFAHRAGHVDSVKPPELDMTERARAFDGAWPYLAHLADIAGTDEVMDPRVVEAYWVGNDLLEQADPAAFSTAITAAFSGQPGADLAALQASPRPLPHHSFHVFAVYPWVGVLRRTGAQQALEVLDRCRIRWGRVDFVEEDMLQAQCQPLTWDGERLRLGAPRPEQVTVAAGGRSLRDGIRGGDWVALHWNWVCDRLDPDQLSALRKFTAHQLAITNRNA